MPYTKQTLNAALRHLRAADPVMKVIIRRVGPCRLKTDNNRYAMLVRSIVSQQISSSAAKSILGRLNNALNTSKPTPEAFHKLTDDELRGAGISPQKLRYLRDLTERTLDGRLRLNNIGRYSDEAVIEQLIEVKGIGRWTAQMFLIFSLGRPDVFPPDDLGVRSAIRRFYGLSELPDQATSWKIAAPWSPYCSIASWYCWRAGDLPIE